VSAAYPNAVRIARSARAPVVTYAAAAGGPDPVDYAARGLRLDPTGARFEVIETGRRLGEAWLPVGGTHNVENALGVVAAARHVGLDFEEIRRGLETFEGVRRRQELRAELRGITVLDDFAHHPTAVRETIAAVRARFPGRRVWAVFEPRSNTSRRRLHQAEYVQAFAGAGRVSIKVPEPHDKVPASERLDVERLTAELAARGVVASAGTDVPALVDEVAAGARPGDVLLVMSNGAFGGFLDTLVARLGQGP
jgi:UDP-N-acetylmuramate: L-alanyl-gamma-D-glutamyl-meso-diaminopimelate ligase